jgi:hypothetical protein
VTGARRRAALVVACLPILTVPIGSVSALASSTPVSAERLVLIFQVDGASFETLMQVPEIRALSRAGGAGLLSSTGAVPPSLARTAPAAPAGAIRSYRFRAEPAAAPAVAGVRIRAAVLNSGAARALVIVTSLVPSPAMLTAKDELHPIVVAAGAPDTLFPDAGPLRTLTSGSTRRTGVVVDADLGPTIEAFLGRADGARSSGGHPIRVVDDPPPFELHERYLAMRRMTVPIQTAAALYVTIAGLFCIAVVALGRRVPTPIAVIATGAAISVGPLAGALLAAGHLSSLSYATVVPFVILVTLLVTGIVVLGATVELMHPLYPLGVVLLGFLIVEAVLGWKAALTPFLGGSELDGGRFYGMPNVVIGLLLGASVLVAQRLTPRAGFVLLIAAGLFAGLPYLGANLGGAITLFAAAGLWLPLRSRGRLRWAELGFALAVAAIGTAVILVAHRISPLPTHITNFEEHAGGVAGAWRTFVDRLAVGVRLIEHNPFALVPVVGVLATLAVVLRPPSAIAASLERHPAWRDALLVILLASVVAYLANDSGPAACGVGFGMALGGLMYVSVAERTWKIAPGREDGS